MGRNTPIHSTQFLKCGSDSIYFPSTCYSCSTSLANSKFYFCMFCEPKTAFCLKCTAPTSSLKHQHPLMVISPDFNKCLPILIHKGNAIVGKIDSGKEWNKECFACSKLIKVNTYIYLDKILNLEWTYVSECVEKNGCVHMLCLRV